MSLINVIPSFYTNVKLFGAKGDGATDDTAAIAAALASVPASGGGVFFPPGTYISGPQTLASFVHLLGAGIEATIIKLKNGSNADLFSANTSFINLAAANGAGNTGGIKDFSIRDLTLDGNRANQTDTVANPTVAATTGSASNAGGNLLASTSYTFGYTYKTAAGETKLVSATTAYSPPAGTNTNQITLTAPALPAGATGTNWYLTASADGAAKIGLIGTSATNTFAVTSAPSSWNPAIQAPPWNLSTVCYPLRFYGYAFILQNLRIRNGETGGVLIDWNGGSTSPDSSTINNAESQWTNVIIHDCNNIGLQLGGPHDSHFVNVVVYNTGSHNIHLAPNASALLMTDVTCYGSTHGVNAVGMLIESASHQITNLEPNGSDTVQMAVLANGSSFFNARPFVNSSSTTGLQIGQQAGQTPYPGQILQSGGLTTAAQVSGLMFFGRINNCDGANGSVWFANDGGNFIVADIFNGAGGVVSTGPVATTTSFFHRDRGINAQISTLLRGSTLALVESSSAPAIANNGTISTPTWIGVQRVAPTGNVTGIILANGSVGGQEVWVRNESAFTVTFAVAGTSHVADGATAAIPANAARLFIWSGATALWYRAA